jgi:hypothetical protein
MLEEECGDRCDGDHADRSVQLVQQQPRPQRLQKPEVLLPSKVSWWFSVLILG